MTATITVLIIDDHRMFADAVVQLLAAEADIEPMGVASAEEALGVVDAACPDVVLMDIDLPGMDGVKATRRIMDECPEARVVAVTGLQSDTVLGSVIEAGAVGLVPKTRAAEEVADVIRRAAAGEVALSEIDAAVVLDRLGRVRRVRADADLLLDQLTPRELEMLQEVANGFTTHEIAESKGISPETVHSHVKNVLAKLGVRSKLDAVLFLLRHGGIQMPHEPPNPDISD